MDGTVILPNLVGVLAPLLLQTLAYGQYFTFLPAAFKPQSRVCTSDRDCDGSEDFVCWWLYEGCNSGFCMCDPRTHQMNSDGRCIRVRRANEVCDGSNDTCIDTLKCINGTCQCPYRHHHYHYHHDLSNPWCIPPNFRPLGARCNPSTDICYHNTAYGYSEREAECSRAQKICKCKDAYKQDRNTCRRLYIWETGCRKDYQCEGGAVCVDEQCACPTGYKSVAGNTKCAKIGATLELPLRSRCDEINERRYCARSLVCHRCQPNEAINICTRYLPGVEVDKSPLHSGSMISEIHLIISILISLYHVFVVR